MAAFFPLLFAAFAGLCVAMQSPSNAMLARSTGSIWFASLVSFTGGVTLLLAIWALFDRTPVAMVRQAPPWAWIGGLYGVVFVAAVAYATPRLGLAVTLTVTLAAQLSMAVVLDHFGWLGLKQEPVTLTRLAGLALVVAGVFLVRR
ncbi:DMT family transporter [Sphingomonas sp. NBWT7]|uniref:DMT family transporter n=1 Tax=Sphingomonas sp. NBWT7 TaxID=2596913 RepID=UPI001628B807|nr:DMT family transporter [Sphingomonas sp. NBWT7]QNE31346.1 DMT family transporter [Sphingomonas sp. NBWT7]